MYIKNRHRNRKQFSQAYFLFQGCLFKSSFEMRILFEIVFPLKPTFHIFIFKDIKSVKMESVYIFKDLFHTIDFVTSECYIHIMLVYAPVK